MESVYILQESSTRDGLNFDYFCKDKDGLIKLVRRVVKERFIDELVRVDEIFIGTQGSIIVRWKGDYEKMYTFDQFSYIKVEVR